MRGRRILITGGAGFIGSELTHQLWKRGASITVVDNLVNGRRENVPELWGERCRLVVVDIRDTPVMQALLQGVDVVFHDDKYLWEIVENLLS